MMLAAGGFDPNFDPLQLLVLALANPVVIVVAFLMGRSSNQWQKIVIAGFASSLAGVAVIWLATRTGILPPRPFGSDGGIFVFSFLYGMVIAYVGYRFRRQS